MILHSLHLWPQTLPCKSIACLPAVLDMPLVERIPLLDDAGVEYAVDAAPTEGFLLLVAVYTLLRCVILPLIRH